MTTRKFTEMLDIQLKLMLFRLNSVLITLPFLDSLELLILAAKKVGLLLQVPYFFSQKFMLILHCQKLFLPHNVGTVDYGNVVFQRLDLPLFRYDLLVKLVQFYFTLT